MSINPPPVSGVSPDAGPEPQRGQAIGALLRRTREGRRIAITTAAAALRIRRPYLEAIEKGAYDRLPGHAYAVGFVRAYADYLGLDGEEAARRFKREIQGSDSPPDLALPMPIAERSIPGGRILLAALILAVCGYGFWFYLGSSHRGQSDNVAAVPRAIIDEPSTPSEAKAAMRELPPAPVIKPSAPVATPPAAPTTPPIEKAAATATATVGADLKPAPAAPADGHVFGVAEGPVRVVLRFTGDCWIQIKGTPDAATGKLLHAGDVYRVPNLPDMNVRIGNSEHVAILLDGKSVTLPPANSLVRTVNLDPDVLASWAKTPSAGPPPATPAAARPVNPPSNAPPRSN